VPCMQIFASLFVGKPQNIPGVALAFSAGYLEPRFSAPGMGSNAARCSSRLSLGDAMRHGSDSFSSRRQTPI
jgi:hypothetical protein